MVQTTSFHDAPVVLVVDDHCWLRRLATDLLTFEGFRTLEAACGAEVLELVSHQQPDVILMDFYLPDVAGVEVCRRLKKNQQTASIPVIFTTVEQGKKPRDLSQKVGGSDLIQKPLDRQDLSQRVRSLLPQHPASLRGILTPVAI